MSAASDLPPARAIVTYALCLGAGPLLFFVAFAAVFNGLWPVLAIAIASHAAVGATAVWLGRARPLLAALALALGSLPWLGWLFPGVLMEAGPLRALLWPGIAAAMFALAWLGGLAVDRVRTRRASDGQTA